MTTPRNPSTVTLTPVELRTALCALRGAEGELRRCEHVARFLAEVLDGDDFAWDMHGTAVAALLRYWTSALAFELTAPPDGLGLADELLSTADILDRRATDAD
ncbi:MAG: hypothetical protein V2I39_08080 [Erythrobacter sp.]|jgi:hypothetical protein|nr:hypothetical protein [Erythrobacter sp.]